MKVLHNIVYSTKGGCGKTTFALNFTKYKFILKNDVSELFDDRPGNNEIFKATKKGVFIDLDLLSSNVYNILDTDSDFKKHTKINNTNYHSLIEYLYNGARFVFEENYDNNMIIYSTKDETERGFFKSKRRYVPVIKYDEFKYGMNKIICELCNENQDKIEKTTAGDISQNKAGEEVDIIYDLPPNSDGYTEIFFDCVLSYKGKVAKVKEEEEKKLGRPLDRYNDNVRLFLITNPSEDIQKVNLDWLKSFLAESGSNVFPKQIIFLVNNYDENYKKQMQDLCYAALPRLVKIKNQYTDIELYLGKLNKFDYILPNVIEMLKI